MVEILHVISEAIFALIAKITYTKLKIFLLTCYSQKQNLFLCKPPTDNRFLDFLSKGLNDFNLMENDPFILGDTNINILDNGHNILDKYKDMSKRNSNFGAIPIKYAQICSTLGLKQLIKHPTRITCYTLTLIDHVIGLFQKKAKQGGTEDMQFPGVLKK